MLSVSVVSLSLVQFFNVQDDRVEEEKKLSNEIKLNPVNEIATNKIKFSDSKFFILHLSIEKIEDN
jgi:hypothetical protein